MSRAIEQRPNISLVSPGDVNHQHTYRQKYTIFKHTPPRAAESGCLSANQVYTLEDTWVTISLPLCSF